MMKALIKIVVESDEFNEDQKKIIKMFVNVLILHEMSVSVKFRNKKLKVDKDELQKKII